MVRWLGQNTTMGKEERRTVTYKIMKLRKSSSLDRFEQRKEILRAQILKKEPSMDSYFDDFVECLRNYVIIPSLNDESGFLDTDFKTQRNESLNSLLGSSYLSKNVSSS